MPTMTKWPLTGNKDHLEQRLSDALAYSRRCQDVTAAKFIGNLVLSVEELYERLVEHEAALEEFAAPPDRRVHDIPLRYVEIARKALEGGDDADDE